MEKIIKNFMQDNFKCDTCEADGKALRVKSVEMYGSALMVHMSCNECDAEWTEIFDLDKGYVGYEDEDGCMHFEDGEEEEEEE